MKITCVGLNLQVGTIAHLTLQGNCRAGNSERSLTKCYGISWAIIGCVNRSLYRHTLLRRLTASRSQNQICPGSKLVDTACPRGINRAIDPAHHADAFNLWRAQGLLRGPERDAS